MIKRINKNWCAFLTLLILTGSGPLSSDTLLAKQNYAKKWLNAIGTKYIIETSEKISQPNKQINREGLLSFQISEAKNKEGYVEVFFDSEFTMKFEVKPDEESSTNTLKAPPMEKNFKFSVIIDSSNNVSKVNIDSKKKIEKNLAGMLIKYLVIPFPVKYQSDTTSFWASTYSNLYPSQEGLVWHTADVEGTSVTLKGYNSNFEPADKGSIDGHLLEYTAKVSKSTGLLLNGEFRSVTHRKGVSIISNGTVKIAE